MAGSLVQHGIKVYKDYGNAFSFLPPVIQYDKYGCALTKEQLGCRWRWRKTANKLDLMKKVYYLNTY